MAFGITRPVVPFARGGHAAAFCLDQRVDTQHYLEVVDQLSGEALTPTATLRFIEQVAYET
jgi:hypothetical protein